MTPFDWNEPIAKPLACLLAVALLIMGVGAAASCHYRAKATQAEAQANVAKGEADAAKRQAQAKDMELAAKDAGIIEARAKVAASDREVERLRKLSHRVDPIPPEGDNTPQPIPPAVDLAAMVSALEQANADKAALIQGLEAQNTGLRQSRDFWKISAEAREVENLNLRASNAAKDGLIKGALWKGRFQGFWVGVASRDIAGRLIK